MVEDHLAGCVVDAAKVGDAAAAIARLVRS